MKKSEIYRIAQKAVIYCEAISANEKLEVLRELMAKEDIERFSEERENQE